MEAEIIAVGTELLLGDILNTNAQYLSRALANLGINVHFQSVVGDNPARLRSVVELALSRSDLLVFSGGLGPTEDDLTKQTVAEAFGDTLRFDAQECAKIEAFFAAWGRTMPENNKKQAMVPVRGRKLLNANGTAPGMLFERDGKYAVLLPGPPKELVPMFEQQVKPWLASLSENVLYSTTLRVVGVGESHLEAKVAPLLESTNPTAALYAKTAEVVVRITAKAHTQAAAKAMCDALAGKFEAILGDAIYGRDVENLETAVVQALAARGKTVALAESCTGGLLGARLTSVSGASAVLGFGMVTYSNEAKQKLLGVRAETLAQYGAVSGETAAEMAVGARRTAGADFGVSLTGIAGPTGGTPEKPVGTVYIAAADETTVYVHKLVVTGRPRETVRANAVQTALAMLRRLALDLPQPAAQKFSIDTPAHMAADTVIKDV